MKRFCYVPNKIIEKGKLYVYFYIMTYYKPYLDGFVRTDKKDPEDNTKRDNMTITLHYDFDSYYLGSINNKKRYKKDYIAFVKDVYGVNYKKDKLHYVVEKEVLKKYNIGIKSKRYAVVYYDEFEKIMNMSTRYRLNSLYFLCVYRVNMKRRSWNNEKTDRYANYYKCLYKDFYDSYGFGYKSIKSVIDALNKANIIYAVREGENITVFNEAKNKSYNRQFLYITDYKDDKSHITEIMKAVRLEEENSKE